MVPAGIKAGSAFLWGLLWRLPPTLPSRLRGSGTKQTPCSSFQSPLCLESFGQHLIHHGTHGGSACLRRGRCSEGTLLGLPRGCEGSVSIEFFQDRGVGVFKQPLLGK